MHQRTRAVCCVANNLDPQRLLTARLVQRFPACGHPFSRDMGAATSADSADALPRSEEHTSELQSLMRISYAVFCLKNKNKTKKRKYQYKKHRTLTQIEPVNNHTTRKRSAQ